VSVPNTLPKTYFRFTAAAAAVLILLAPALWNGFALLQYDTGGYLARWYEGHLEESRSTVYGLYLALLARPDFWPAVAVQALLTVWVLWLVLRAQGMARPAILLATTAALSLVTALPFLASMLLTDVFAGLAVLGLYLVTLRADTLVRWERGALIVLIAFSAATHAATLAVVVALLLAGSIAALIERRMTPPRIASGDPTLPFQGRMTRVPLAGLARGTSAAALSVVLLLAANYVVAQRIAWTPGGTAIAFGRMLQAGIVARYLAEHCPDPRLPKLCEHRQKIPNDTDQFFWGSDLFDELGRFEGLGDEMRRVARESLTAYPWMQIRAAVAATAEQLVRVATGYGVHNDLWHTYWTFERFAPQALPAMKAARQQSGALPFDAINRVHVPVALACMLLLLGVMALATKGRGPADLAALAAVATLAILANAAVCGALANPHDRYGARIVWLAVLVVVMGVASCLQPLHRRTIADR
jgi:hypothetical protein